MGIRISCSEMEKFEHLGDLWVEFREDRWTFGDRRKISESFSDSISLGIILSYVEGWNVKNISNEPIEFLDEDGNRRGVEILDNVEDSVAIWLVSAWYAARARRSDLKKVN